MSQEQINQAIVKFEAVIFANQPAWETKEEYVAYCAWMEERKVISNRFKALLVDGNIDAAKQLYNSIKAQA